MKKFSPLVVFIIFIVLFAGYVTTFLSGIYFSRMLTPQTPPLPVTLTPTPTTTKPVTLHITPGKHYFDDTVLLLEKNEPYRTLIATVTRTQEDQKFGQETRVSYFDGKTWTRKIHSDYTTSSEIQPSALISTWKTTIDSSRVLKEQTAGTGQIAGSLFSFQTGELHNEISMRSLPGYTKFMSEGMGTFVLDGTAHDAYVLYTRIYSLNADDIQFYTTPLGLTTDWVAFWDTKGNFYHIDSTNVDKPTPLYTTHQIGVKKSFDGAVTKTFKVNIQRDTDTPPTNYSIHLDSPIGDDLSFHRINSLNKAPNGSYAWYIGLVNGAVEKNGTFVQGIGVAEYIKD